MSRKYFPHFSPPKTKWVPLGKSTHRFSSKDPYKMLNSSKLKLSSNESNEHYEALTTPLQPTISIDNSNNSFSLGNPQTASASEFELPSLQENYSNQSFSKISNSRKSLNTIERFDYKIKSNKTSTSFMNEDNVNNLIKRLEPKLIKFVSKPIDTSRSLSPKKKTLKYYSSRSIREKKEYRMMGPVVVGNMIAQIGPMKSKTERRKKLSRNASNVNTTTYEIFLSYRYPY